MCNQGEQKKWLGLKPSLFVDIVIGLVALSALGISIMSMQQEKNQAHVGVRPRLTMNHVVNEDKPRSEIILENNGLGPAEILSFNVNGLKCEGNYKEVQDEIEKRLEPILRDDVKNEERFHFSGFDPGFVVKDGTSHSVVWIDRSDIRADVNAHTVLKHLDDISFRIEYQDLYGNEQEPFECP